MSKQHSESGYYWVDREITCNGCKYLNFQRRGCRLNQPPMHVKPLDSFQNGDGYIAILKPSDCTYDNHKKQENAQTQTEQPNA